MSERLVLSGGRGALPFPRGILEPVNITAKEIGRSLVITLGGATDDMSEEEREIAAQGVTRIVVQPVTAQQGAEIWAHYARILFATTEEDENETAVRMTRIALNAYADDDATPEEADRAAAQWARIEALRWSEAEQVSQIALYWQSQGGGIDVVEALLRDGHPKAQELLLTANDLWNVYSRLRMLMRSQSSDAANAILEQVASRGTNTRSGTSSSDDVDAFGIRQTA